MKRLDVILVFTKYIIGEYQYWANTINTPLEVEMLMRNLKYRMKKEKKSEKESKQSFKTTKIRRNPK